MISTHTLSLLQRGELSMADVDRLHASAHRLESRQPVYSELRAKHASTAFGQALMIGGATALGASLAGLAGHGIGTAISKGMSSMTFDRDFNKMIAASPDLKQYPPDQVKAVFTSVRAMSEEYSADPLLAGTAVSQILRNRDPLNPHGPPRFDVPLAKTIAEAGKVTREHSQARELRDMMSRAGQTGVSTGANVYLQARNAETARKLMLEDRAEGREYSMGEAARNKLEAAEANAKGLSEAEARKKREAEAAHQQRIQRIVGGLPKAHALGGILDAKTPAQLRASAHAAANYQQVRGLQEDFMKLPRADREAILKHLK